MGKGANRRNEQRTYRSPQGTSTFLLTPFDFALISYRKFCDLAQIEDKCKQIVNFWQGSRKERGESYHERAQSKITSLRSRDLAACSVPDCKQILNLKLWVRSTRFFCRWFALFRWRFLLLRARTCDPPYCWRWSSTKNTLGNNNLGRKTHKKTQMCKFFSYSGAQNVSCYTPDADPGLFRRLATFPTWAHGSPKNTETENHIADFQRICQNK